MITKKKGLVFRVTGLPASQNDVELHEALLATINDNLEEHERSHPATKIAIVPSCQNHEEKVALVEFLGAVPMFLSQLTTDPMDSWQVEMGDIEVSFDQHFSGFTQLYTPGSGSRVTADIIAISGLDSHAYGSWRGKGNFGRMWLRDFLSQDMPCCRTMIFGYNSKLSAHAIDSIMDYGRGLREELTKIRNTDELRKRPLFFIAHGFGGIILTHCLVKIAQMDDDKYSTTKSLLRATYGMLLFGTPHKGLVVSDLQRMVACEENHSRSALLEQIGRNSDLLAYQLDNFKNHICGRKIVSFYETGQTRQRDFDDQSGRWRRTGDFFTAVDIDSALLQLPDYMEDKVPVQANHSTMVKFDTRSDRGYTTAREKLRQFEQDSAPVVSARFLNPRLKRKPTSTVPFQRDRAFVGREDALAIIAENLDWEAFPDHCRAALVGIGGVGKSQIAIEYSYRLREAAPQTWVFWVHASNCSRFEQAYRDIATMVELPDRDNPEVDILKLVYNWLCDERNGSWLMILDNADDDRVFSSSRANDGKAVDTSSGKAYERPPLGSFLPQSANGRILVTSRDSIAAMNLIGANHAVIKVDVMEQTDALRLLKTRVAVDEAFEEDAKALVDALGHFPLAITHAAAYLAVRAPTTNIRRYLYLFNKSEKNQAHMLSDQSVRDIRRDGSVSNAVTMTWQVSFRQIQETAPAAADLLSLMAMFDGQGISECLLSHGKEKLEFEDAVATLTSFSLIKSQSQKQLEYADEKVFEIHGLIRLATRKWLMEQERARKWQQESLRIMAAVFCKAFEEKSVVCLLLLPHAQKVLSDTSEEKVTLDEINLSLRTVACLKGMGDYKTAEKIGRTALARVRKAAVVERSDLGFARHLAMILDILHEYKEAESMCQRAIENSERTLGKDDVLTAFDLLSLARTLAMQRTCSEAERLYLRTLNGHKNTVGISHSNTIESMTRIGFMLWQQGRLDDDAETYRQGVRLSTDMFGEGNLKTLYVLNSLAVVLAHQGKFDLAEAKIRQVLGGYTDSLGEKHSCTLNAITRLCQALSIQGKNEEAEHFGPYSTTTASAERRDRCTGAF